MMIVRLFRRSFTVAAAVIGGYAAFVRPWHLHWGATDEEFRQDLPGDDLIAAPNLAATRAITIAAPAADVWPWLVQMGQGRGGLYSYDWLENLIGCDMHSADRIVAEFQVLKVGDPFRLAPGSEPALVVATMEPDHALILQSTGALPDFDFTWAFVLIPADGGGTRLIVRERYTYGRRSVALMVEVVEALSFIMTQKMLREIKRRAEGAAGISAGPHAVPEVA